MDPTFINPMDSFSQGLGIGNALLKTKMLQEAAQAAQAKAAAEAAAEAQRQEVFKKLQAPGATFEDYQKASILFNPEQAKAIQAAATNMRSDQQQSALKDNSEIFSAFRLGRTDIAASLLQQQADAARSAGNEQGAKFAETLIGITKDPMGAKAVENLIGYQMAALPGGKDAFDAINKLEADRRINNDVSLKQQLADLDKTRAETAKLLSEAGGKLKPEQIIAGEDELRKELYSNNNTFRTIDFNYNVIKDAEQTGIGDVGLVFAIMKMYDPISVVREGEQATAQNSAGVPSAIIGLYNNLVGGGKMGDKQREQIRSQAGKVWQKSKETADKNVGLIKDIAKQRGLNIDNIIQKEQQQGSPPVFQFGAP
jgi:hypothetical protein